MPADGAVMWSYFFNGEGAGDKGKGPLTDINKVACK